MEDEEDKVTQTNHATDEQDSVEVVITAGELLQSMRQQSNQEVECIASALKVSPAQLHALEANDFGSESSLYFTRALAARVCRHLNQDPTEVLTKMPSANVNANTTAKHAFKHAPMQPTPITKRNRIPLWLILVFVGLLLAAATVYALPWLQKQLKNKPNTTPQTAETTSVTPDVLQAQATVENANLLATAEEEKPMVQEGILELSASGKTWIKIATAKGESIYEEQLVKGQTHKLALTQYPVHITVGKAQNTTVLHNGNKIELKQHTKQGVARFEIEKP